MKKAGKRKGRVREDDSYASAPDKIPEAADKAPSVDAQIDQVT